MVGSAPASTSSSATSVITNGDTNGSSTNGAVVVPSASNKNNDDTSVRVALRIRPLLPREVINNCKTCTYVTPGASQVVLGGQQAFTYDYVFDQSIDQETVFENVRTLIEGCLEGFNATIIAYGQTGSGKTYTMGTGFDIENIDAANSGSQGIVPRAVHYLFECMSIKKATTEAAIKPSFKVSIQFIELYNEDIIDLVDGQQSNKIKRNQNGSGSSQVRIHEDVQGGIYLVGVGTQIVNSAEETLKCLRLGALGRTTASTNMNDQSSRSHAIFTIHIEQTRVVTEEVAGGPPDFETLTAKFHFVDLAGSERLKRTGATGDRQKEGISINCGLLALGNVISALGDKSKKALHIPYRDSKLTRLLQDSLGGNSRTIMIACVSPSDADFAETLNTLKYANRARNIKNKVTINQDKSSRLIAELKERIRELEDELLEFKQGKRTIDPTTGEEIESDTYHESKMLQHELNALKLRNESLQSTVNTLTAKNSQLLTERTLSTLNGGADPELAKMVTDYTKEIEEISTKLIESEYENERLKRKLELAKTNSLNHSFSPNKTQLMAGSRPSTAPVPMHFGNEENVSDVLEVARREIEMQTEQLKRLKHASGKSVENEVKSENISGDEEGHQDDEGQSTADEGEDNDEENYSQLAALSSEITTKQKLIETLESTQRRYESMMRSYEEKLACLSKKIATTENERDKVLQTTQPSPKLNEIKMQYEKQLTQLRSDLKKWQQSQKEHQKALKENSEKAKYLDQLKSEVEKMKQAKVKLMNQIKADAVKFRTMQTARAKEIAQLKKEQRKKDNMIRQLTTEKTAQAGILKRKHEEINYLKNKMRAPALKSKANSKKASPIKGKQNWALIQVGIMKTVNENQKMESAEAEMMKVIEERKQLNLDLEECQIALRSATLPEERNKILDQMDTLTKSLEYAEKRLGEIQREILCYGDTMDEDISIESVVQKLNKEECSYIMEKMYHYCRENVGSSRQYEKRVALLEKENQKIAADLAIVKELYRHLYTECNNNRDEFLPPDSLASFGASTATISDSVKHEPMDPSSASTQSVEPSQPIDQKSRKARRLTATPAQLLGTTATTSASTTTTSQAQAHSFIPPAPVAPVMSASTDSNGQFVHPNDVTFIKKRPLTAKSAAGKNTDNFTTETRIPDYARRERRGTYTIDDTPPPQMFSSYSGGGQSSEPVNGNGEPDGDMNMTFVVPPSHDDDTEEDMEIPETTFIDSPFASPVSSRRSAQTSNPTVTSNNVFQRLTSQTTSDGAVTKGKISVLRATRGIVSNTHIAQGHSKSISSICATENRLYSGGVDTTVKIWDLNAKIEVQTLVGNPGNIAVIRCSSNENLIFTASSYLIKVWDRRVRNRCIKTWTSSGSEGEDIPSQQVPINSIPYNEQHIHALSVTSNSMFSSFGDKVRAWDLRKMKGSCGLLPGKHGSNIMCLEAKEMGAQTTLVTGSKDHRIKVYKLRSNSAVENTQAKLMLEPPHYDGIQSLLLSEDLLFSGSRDCCIKKWDLSRAEGSCMVQAMNNAHSGWVTGLAFVPQDNKHILSVSRDGFMKLWSVDGNELGKFEVTNKGQVECIATNSSHIFTGSNDGNIGFWKIRADAMLSPPRTPAKSANNMNYDPNYMYPGEELE